MAKSVDEITNEAIGDGGYLCLLYFDMHASSEDAVKNIMVGFVAKLTKEEGVIYALGDIDKPIVHDELYSASAEVKILIKDLPSFTRICAQYSPIGIEILRPHEVKLSLGELQEALLSVAQLSSQFASILMQKGFSQEESALYSKKLEQRMKLGKNLLERKNK